MSKKREIKEENKKIKFSKIIVTLVIILNIIFAGGVLYVFLKTSNEPSVLVGSWFAFTGTELWSLSSIKKKEINNEKREV